MKTIILKQALGSWIRGLLLYALLTLPAMVWPPMYVISIGLATLWSLPGVALYALALATIMHFEATPGQRFAELLITTVFIVFGCTWGAAWHITEGKEVVSEYLGFILFPLVGMAAGALAVLVQRKTLTRLFSPAYED